MEWGDKAERRRTSESYWKQPLKWNREAMKAGERRRVFCASLADVFEDREELVPWRRQLWELIEQTPWLTWLLLTKRPENFNKFLPWGYHSEFHPLPWPNVWLGITAENQEWLLKRWPLLAATPAVVRFISYEPALGPIDLVEARLAGPCGYYCDEKVGHVDHRWPDWIIGGAESGPQARPTHPQWFRDIRDQCLAQGIPYLHKQNGEWLPQEGDTGGVSNCFAKRRILWPNGDSGTVWFADAPPGAVWMQRVGKKKAGRLLDGVLHDQFPAPPSPALKGAA